MSAASTSQPVTSSAPPFAFSSNAPLPLSAAQESQVREIYYRNVRRKCADEIRDFAACALDRTLTASILCRTERRAMNTCMIHHATRDAQDAARTEWFATRDQRRAELDAKEARRKEQEKFHLDWWAKDGSNPAPGTPPTAPSPDTR